MIKRSSKDIKKKLKDNFPIIGECYFNYLGVHNYLLKNNIYIHYETIRRLCSELYKENYLHRIKIQTFNKNGEKILKYAYKKK